MIAFLAAEGFFVVFNIASSLPSLVFGSASIQGQYHPFGSESCSACFGPGRYGCGHCNHIPPIHSLPFENAHIRPPSDISFIVRFVNNSTGSEVDESIGEEGMIGIINLIDINVMAALFSGSRNLPSLWLASPPDCLRAVS